MTTAMSRRTALAALGAAPFALARRAQAQETVSIEISLKNQQFQPREIRAPADKRIVLRVKNLDAKAMEFESVSLRVEKVVVPNGVGIINLRPLKPGRYNFFDDFNPSATGTLIVE